MQNLWKNLSAVIALILVLLIPVSVYATESIIAANTLMEISEQADVYEQANGQGTVLATLEVGTPVISAEDINMSGTGEEWCKVSYQNITGYIQLKQLKQFIADDVEEQFDKVSNMNKLVFEEIEYEKSQNSQKLVWGIVIAALVIAIFAVGIVSAVYRNKNEKNMQESDEKEE